MITGLVQDTQKKHILQQFPLPEFEEAGGLWICPFCQPVDKLPEAYSIITPPISQEQQLHAVKSTIKLHLEEHRKKLCKRMANESRLATYEKNRTERMKRVRLWIEGTVKDRGLYEKNPF